MSSKVLPDRLTFRVTWLGLGSEVVGEQEITAHDLDEAQAKVCKLFVAGKMDASYAFGFHIAPPLR